MASGTGTRKIKRGGMNEMDLTKITAKSTLADLEGIRFRGANHACTEFIKILCFSLYFAPDLNQICLN